MSAVLETACALDPVEGFTLGGTVKDPRRTHLQLRGIWLFGKTHVLVEGKLVRTGEHMGRLHHCTLHIHPRADGDCCLSFGTSNTPVTHQQAQIIREALEDLGLHLEFYGEGL